MSERARTGASDAGLGVCTSVFALGRSSANRPPLIVLLDAVYHVSFLQHKIAEGVPAESASASQQAALSELQTIFRARRDLQNQVIDAEPFHKKLLQSLESAAPPVCLASYWDATTQLLGAGFPELSASFFTSFQNLVSSPVHDHPFLAVSTKTASGSGVFCETVTTTDGKRFHLKAVSYLIASSRTHRSVFRGESSVTSVGVFFEHMLPLNPTYAGASYAEAIGLPRDGHQICLYAAESATHRDPAQSNGGFTALNAAAAFSKASTNFPSEEGSEEEASDAMDEDDDDDVDDGSGEPDDLPALTAPAQDDDEADDGEGEQ